MTWLQLFRRALAVWRLRRRKIYLCDCGMPVTPEEREQWGVRCSECHEARVLKPGSIVEGNWQQLLVPGLTQAFAAQRAGTNDYLLGLQQHVPTPEERMRLMQQQLGMTPEEQQMNLALQQTAQQRQQIGAGSGSADYLGGLLGGLLGKRH